ncbi:hypothetical protein OIU84_006508 [Salix udensis]|uniref:Uncharacterized protein n=1 Tax=Salix udensis TaxID=889485 RepID=A0AAD6P1Y8_9ROSI|nr:hypothetical protein OIU84_006508 [Salix udensis]
MEHADDLVSEGVSDSDDEHDCSTIHLSALGRVCDSRLRNEFYLPKFYTEDVLGWFADHILAVQEMRPNFHPDEVKLDKNGDLERFGGWNTKRWWSCIVLGSLIGNLGEKDKKSESSKITEAEKEVSIEKNSGTKGEKLTVGNGF